jgi:hypothetical protein
MKMYEGLRVQLHAFLTSALGGGEWLASRPDRFTPGERAYRIRWTRGWVGLRAVLNTEKKKKYFIPIGNQSKIPGRPALSLVNIFKELPYIGYKKANMYCTFLNNKQGKQSVCYRLLYCLLLDPEYGVSESFRNIYRLLQDVMSLHKHTTLCAFIFEPADELAYVSILWDGPTDICSCLLSWRLFLERY